MLDANEECLEFFSKPVLITLLSSLLLKFHKSKERSRIQQSIGEERFAKEEFLVVPTLQAYWSLSVRSLQQLSRHQGFAKREALRLIGTISSKVTFTDNIKQIKRRPISRIYPKKRLEKSISELNHTDRKVALTLKHRIHRKLLPIVTQFKSSLPCLKKILM